MRLDDGLLNQNKNISQGIEFENDHHYMPMAKYALEVIFKLGESPDRFTANIVR